MKSVFRGSSRDRSSQLPRALVVVLLSLACSCRTLAPPGIARLDTAAAKAYDEALTGQLPVAAEQARAAAAAWRGLRERIEADGAPSCELGVIDERVAALEATVEPGVPPDAATLARAANAVRAEIGDLLRRYRAFVPARLVELDVLGREIVLDALASEWRAADAAYAEMARGWLRLRPCAERADPAGATGLDACLAELVRPLEARDGPTVIHLAKGCLEQVALLDRILKP